MRIADVDLAWKMTLDADQSNLRLVIRWAMLVANTAALPRAIFTEDMAGTKFMRQIVGAKPSRFHAVAARIKFTSGIKKHTGILTIACPNDGIRNGKPRFARSFGNDQLHNVVPRLGANVFALQGGGILVAAPHAANIIRCIADKPTVVIVVGSSRFPRTLTNALQGK